MQIIQYLQDIDKHLNELIGLYGPWVYAILFLIIFAETGFVVTPFLPGDSLLFTAGLFCYYGKLQLPYLSLVLLVAAVSGDSLNYAIGRWLGPHLLRNEKSRIFKRSHLNRTHAYFEKYGGKTLILARWIAFVRTFAPFVAGLGQMPYPRFLMYSATGGSIWVFSLTILGYLAGHFAYVREHTAMVLFAVVFLPVPVALYEIWMERRKAIRQRREAATAAPPAPESPV